MKSGMILVIKVLWTGFFAFFITMLCFAVLEFELRKAQETIKSLRASLTQEAGKMF